MSGIKKHISPKVRTTPLSIFVASPFSGDGSVQGKVKNNPSSSLGSETGNIRNGAAKTTPNMKRSVTTQLPKRLPPSRSGLSTKSLSTPSLVDDQRNEQSSSKQSGQKGRLHSARFERQHTSGTQFRKKLTMDVPLKNYHSETSLNNLIATPVTFSRGEPKASTSRTDPKEILCEEASKLMVCVRVRPLSEDEKSDPSVKNVVAVDGNKVIVSGNLSRSEFIYDHCFWLCDPGHTQFATQEHVFVTIVKPLIDKVFEGYNACLFAYGQTGSGKSYSMMGENFDSLECLSSEVGIIPRFCHELFDHIVRKDGDSEGKMKKNWKVEITYYEVYNEKIRDLLDESDAANKKCLRVREHPSLGPYVEDISIKEVNSLREVLGWLKIGNNQRFTASTEMNEKSSRSHSIFSLTLTQTQMELVMGESIMNTRNSRCNLIDLAGSERVAQTCSSGERRKEGVSINQSLLTLGKVISALAENESSRKCFAPYRESVLTFLLKESLGGNSRTVMLATISPASSHVDETLATLRYACQARKIVNRVRVNEVPQISVIRSLTADVARLNALREEYEAHMKSCRLGSEELGKLRSQYDEHLRGCTTSHGECPRADCAEVRRLLELQASENHLCHPEEVARLRDELELLKINNKQLDVDRVKGELADVRKEYALHLKSCHQDKCSQLQELREELERASTELSELRSSSVAGEVATLRRQCDEWKAKCARMEEELNKVQQKYKQKDMELCQYKLEHVKKLSHYGTEFDNFNMQLKSIQERMDNFPQFEEQSFPAYDLEGSIESHRAAVLKRLTLALEGATTSPSASEFSISSESLPLHPFCKDQNYTLNDADSSSHSNTTVGRLSTGTDDTNEESVDQTQSFTSYSLNSTGNSEETVEEILYYLQDKSNRLKELCVDEDGAAAIQVLEQAVLELKEVLLTPSTWDLSHHFSPPSPSVTPAKSNLRSPAAPRVPTPKSVKFMLKEVT